MQLLLELIAGRYGRFLLLRMVIFTLTVTIFRVGWNLVLLRLCQSMVIAIDPAVEFKSRNKIEVLNTIVLSDGENTDSFNVVDIMSMVTFNRFKTTPPSNLVLKMVTLSLSQPDSSFYRGWGSISRGISLMGVMELFKSVTEFPIDSLVPLTAKKQEVKNNWHDMTGIRDHWIPMRV